MTDDSSGLVRRAKAFVAVGRGGRPTATGWLLDLVVLATMLTTAWVRTGQAERPSTALLILTLVAWASLLVRTYRPALALLGTVVADVCIIVFLTVPPSVAELSSGMGAYQPAPIATVVAACTLAARAPQRLGWIGGGRRRARSSSPPDS